MEEMGWSWRELMETPYEVYLDISRIISLERKEEKRKNKEQQRKAKQA